MTEEKKTDAVAKYGKSLSVPIHTSQELRQLLLSQQNNIKNLLPPESGVTWQKIESSVMEIAITNPGILQCDGYSVLIAVKTACELGLALIPTAGEAYLVPFFDKKAHKKNCQLMIGYKGKHRLIIDNSDVVMINTVVVYKGDQFEIREGTSPEITHIINPAAPRTKEDIVGFYSIAFFANGFKHIEYMNKDEVDAIRTRSKAPSYGPWSTDYTEMGKKTVDHRHFKRLPLSGEKASLLHKLLQYEYENEGLKDKPLPSVKPGDRMKQLMDRLHNPQEEKEEPPKEQPPPPEKKGEIIDLPVDTEDGFTFAGITDKDEIARLNKKFDGRQEILNKYLSSLADWDANEQQGDRPDEPK